MKPAFLFLLVLVFGFFSSAFTYREQAETERQPPKQNNVVVEKLPTNSAILSLEDPRQDIITRKWNYSFSIVAQQFKPQGFAQNDVGTFNLGNNNSVLFPSIGLGFLSNIKEFSGVHIHGGAQALLGYSNQSTSVLFPSGLVEKNARLSSVLFRLKPTLKVNFVRLPWLSALVGGEWGGLNYTQSSSNSLANFSKQAFFTGWSLGLGWNATPKFSIVAQYTNRAIQDQNLGLQRDNFELGTSFLW